MLSERDAEIEMNAIENFAFNCKVQRSATGTVLQRFTSFSMDDIAQIEMRSVTISCIHAVSIHETMYVPCGPLAEKKETLPASHFKTMFFHKMLRTTF